MGPSMEWWNEQLPVSNRQAAAVGHALLMCGALPPRIAQEADITTRIALLENWLVQMRLLAEFFGISGRAKRQDFTCEAFGVSPAVDPELNQVWALATRHVVHFSNERAPEDLAQVAAFDTSSANLARLTVRMLEVADSFVQVLEVSGHKEAPTFRMHLDEGRTLLQEPNRDMRATEQEDLSWFDYAKWLYEQQGARFASHGTQAMALLGILAILLTLLLQAQIWTPLTLIASGLFIVAAVGSMAALTPWKLQALDVEAIAARFEDFHDRTHASLLPLEASRLMCADDAGNEAPIASLARAADRRGRIFQASLALGVLAVAILGIQIVLSGWETAYGG